MSKPKHLLKKRRTALIAAIMVMLLVAGVVVYAEYIKSSRAKRVLATRGDEGMLFSSNYLVMNSNPNANVYKRVIYASSPDYPVSGDVTICNYAQGNSTKRHETDIPYTLTAQFYVLSEANGVYIKTPASAADVGHHTVKVKLNGGEQITLDSGNISHTFTGNLLDHRFASTDICNVEFDSDFINAGALCLYLCATPDAGAPSDVFPMDAVFSAALSNAEVRNIWEGYFNDNNTTVAPDQPYYDGFNYVVSGSGAGSCVLSWDSSKLEISQIFLAENNLTPVTSGSVSSVTFDVDSDVTARYDLQFYYADEDVTVGDWNALNACVTLTYTETIDGGNG